MALRIANIKNCQLFFRDTTRCDIYYGWPSM